MRFVHISYKIECIFYIMNINLFLQEPDQKDPMKSKRMYSSEESTGRNWQKKRFPHHSNQTFSTDWIQVISVMILPKCPSSISHASLRPIMNVCFEVNSKSIHKKHAHIHSCSYSLNGVGFSFVAPDLLDHDDFQHLDPKPSSEEVIEYNQKVWICRFFLFVSVVLHVNISYLICFRMDPFSSAMHSKMFIRSVMAHFPFV